MTTREFDPASVPGGVFLVRDDGAALTAHTFGLDARARRQLSAVFGARLRVTTHRPRGLDKDRSLAALDRRFSGGPVVYDPTQVFTRLADVLACGQAVRDTLGKRAKDLLFDSTRRTLYIVLDLKTFASTSLTFRAEVAEAMAAVAGAIAAWQRDASLALSVRVGFDPPPGLKLTAIDTQSVPRRSLLSRLAPRLRSAAGVAAVGAITAGAPQAAFAGDSTAAVSQANATITGRGGWDGIDKNLFRGDLLLEGVVPLGHSFGAQGEVAVGADNYYGVGGHLFWRDPSWGLFGAFASAESLRGTSLNRFGGEAEFYFDRLTVGARGGFQNGDVGDTGFGRIDLSFYVTPSFVLRTGYEGMPHLNFGRAGFEFQPAPRSLSGLSLFADGEFGQGTAVFVGFRFHFGEAGGSLVYRDRHEDPGTVLLNDVPLEKAHYSGSTH